MSVQDFADASQKLICSTVTAVVPAFTVAVRVTTAFAGTSVTATPPEVTVRIVLVAILVVEAYWTLPTASEKFRFAASRVTCASAAEGSSRLIRIKGRRIRRGRYERMAE